ncbi:hypothetical protein BGZ52_005666 [Haplosporangium bisporale]|nr:hypothetical protein BGZ52_005666 [Haplosporangium bisporale]
MPAVNVDHKNDENSIIHDPRDANTPDRWIKRHPELIRLTGKHPFNCEPPVPLLLSKGFITPASIHFVRNHGPVPQLSWDTHRMFIGGLVNTEVTLTMDMLTQLPSITIPATLVCAGNRRKEQNMHKQSIGFNWGPGAVSTAIWKGVLVRDLLLNNCSGLREGARFVSFDGLDKLPNGTYGTSLSVERVMNPMNDVMIAYEMNGDRLTPDHGFPVRLIVPGVIGGRMIKYLTKITVSDSLSDSWYHYHDNRVLPSIVGDAEMAEREQWWFRPEYTINDLNINSVICSPAHGSILPISDPQTLTKDITISGYAYNGGCKKITRVEVTLDSGRSWLVSDLEHPEEWPEYRFCNDPFPRQRYWCWCFWSIKVPVRQLLKCKDIHVRAWDSTTNTQPKDLNWNLMGMMNNCCILMNAGGDCSEDFDAIHSANAREMLAKYYIGELIASMPEPSKGAQVTSLPTGLLTLSPSRLSSPTATPRSFVDPKRWQSVALVKKIHLNHNTRLLRFAFGHPDQLLGLPLGNHLLLRIKTNDSLYFRAYTPTSLPDQRGHFDLVVKVYFKDTDSRFPAGGVVSQYLNAMAIGDSIAVKGPVGSFTYKGQSHYSHASGRKGTCLQIGMICGGTGLTPMYQIMQAILADKVHDATKVSLIFGNLTEDDILMRKEIDDAGNGLGPDRFHLWHMLSNAAPDDWRYGTGYINKDVIKEHLFPRTWSAPDSVDDLASRIVLLCGPPPMISQCCLPALMELYGKDFVDNNVFCF